MNNQKENERNTILFEYRLLICSNYHSYMKFITKPVQASEYRVIVYEYLYRDLKQKNTRFKFIQLKILSKRRRDRIE